MTQLNLAKIHMGKEAVAFGTETTAYVVMPGLIEKGDVTPKYSNKEISIGDISSRNEAITALHGSTENSVKIKMRLQNGRPFQWIQGGYSVSGTYDHAIINSNTIPSYSIEHVINEDYSHKFLGCKCDELVITITKDQPVICEASFKAKSHSIDATPGTPPSALSTVPLEFHQITTLSINSVSYLTDIRQVKITMGNNLELDGILSSRDVGQIPEGRRKCMISFELWEQDEVLLDLLKNMTDFPISLIMTRGTDTFTFTVANAKIFDPSQDFGKNAVADILPIRVLGDWTVDFHDSETDYNI